MEDNNYRSRNERKHPFIQKYKVNSKKQKNRQNVYSNESEEKEYNARNSESIIIAEIRVKDNRRRDIDGMVATILDCLVGADILKDDSIGEVDSIIAHASKSKKSGFKIVLLEKID